MKKIAISTLGCKVNQFESAAIASSLEQAGCRLVSFSGPADVYIINTCAVTGRAGQQSRQLIRRAMKTNPAALLIVTGCYAQMASQDILEISQSPLCIVGNGNKQLVAEMALSENSCDLSMLTGNIGLKKEITPLEVTRFQGRTRAYLRIQDGCNNFCSYCIVPYTRGRSRSLSPDRVMRQVAVFARQGYREVVITGINVGKYGLDLAEQETLNALLARLCLEFPAIRFRLSSVELAEVDDRLLELLAAHDNFMPHLHIPLQSGDDSILARMNRRYQARDFARTVDRIHKALPDAAIGCDILCGFPGETAEAHANTLSLIRELPVTYLHVFPYSRRPGTLAASMNRQLEKQVKEERVRQLRALDRQKRNDFHHSQIGTVRPVLVERHTASSGLCKGFSDNYLPLHFPGSKRLPGTIVAVHITGMEEDNIFGEIDETRLEIME